LIKLVEVGLAAEGFDGLYVSGVCGCLAGELSPGSCIGEDCSAGYKHTHSATGEWIVGGRPKSEGYSDREIENILADCG